MHIAKLLRQLHEAEDRRRSAPRYSEAYFEALRDVERLARELWKAAQAESPATSRSITI
jgi:hypothetical protein